MNNSWSRNSDWDRFSDNGDNPHAAPNYRGRGPKGFSRSDERIYEDVCDRLERDPFIDASGVEVGVHRGLVTLTGTVPSRKMKLLSEACLSEITGIKDINNSLRVRDVQ